MQQMSINMATTKRILIKKYPPNKNSSSFLPPPPRHFFPGTGHGILHSSLFSGLLLAVNLLLFYYFQMEEVVGRMQDEKGGVPVRTVKSFLTKIPSVFTAEALHIAHLMSSHGYFFPIDDHTLTVKNDGTFYRFQTPYFWPSHCWDPENTDYAVYLCKRTMQNKTRLELADYEAENLAKLQKMLSRKWEFIFMQAEAQSKVDKKRDKLERKVLDSQERAFWDVHRPCPGCVNTTEVDLKKSCRNKANIIKNTHQRIYEGKICPNMTEAELEEYAQQCKTIIESLRHRIDRRNVKNSKVAESYITSFDLYQDYDPFITVPEPSNPWVSDNTDFWEIEKQTKEISVRRVKRWGYSLKELLKDPAGRDQFVKFLEKEFSLENLKFWDAVQELKQVHSKDVSTKVLEIWNEYLAPEANAPINIDSKSAEETRKNMKIPTRWAFDEAAASSPISDIISRNNMLTFANRPDPKIKGKNDRGVQKHNMTLVTQLFLSLQSRLNADMTDFFRYENQRESPNLADRGLLRSGTKSDILQCLNAPTGRAVAAKHATVVVAHLYNLMKNDTYTRYLRSEMYREYFNGSKKKQHNMECSSTTWYTTTHYSGLLYPNSIGTQLKP
ncbi:Regulator of G-protein signaling 7 [Nymphon striatum]|nr:Regulator of G-protein signaling 7 [Nymphon striatum]